MVTKQWSVSEYPYHEKNYVDESFDDIESATSFAEEQVDRHQVVGVWYHVEGDAELICLICEDGTFFA